MAEPTTKCDIQLFKVLWADKDYLHYKKQAAESAAQNAHVVFNFQSFLSAPLGPRISQHKPLPEFFTFLYLVCQKKVKCRDSVDV